jgi:hypothetical protein
MQESAKERKASAKLSPEEQRVAGEREVLAKIADMPEPDRSMAQRIHEVVTTSAPALVPRTYYGMPAYSRDGKTICFSGAFGTYCFHTDSHEWTKAGTWKLPFVGRALQVPELYNLYFGFHDDNPDNVVALELPSPLQGADAPPKVLLQWRGLCPPHQDGCSWSLMDSSLLYLGNYRFCIAKWFSIYHGSPFEADDLVDMAAVLTGVEIVNGQGNKEKLQMVKHKTRTFIYEYRNLESVL